MGVISAYLEHINLKDLMDIVVVALLIYQILLIIKGTRAVQILAGVALLAILFAFGVAYKLYTLNWLLAHFFNSLFIILIILFQDQIRSALASFGSGKRVLGGFKKVESDSEIDEVVEACGILAKKRKGALLVFERTHALKTIMDTGTALNSKIHADLLVAIFDSSSPLHDGAVIIAGGKLAAAGCFLPLSDNVEIDRHLGTRHRAALGASERTDAIVVIVSEETGRMMVCLNGIFYHADDERCLRRYLKYLGTNESVIELPIAGGKR